jgi:stage II sporulation protein AA (anti-sigma F factor antagonist)
MSLNTSTGYRMLKIDCDMDALAAKKLRTMFDGVIASDRQDVILDMSEVEFLDSSGVGALVFLLKGLSKLQRKLRLVGVGGQPGDLLSQLQIDRAAEIQCVSNDETPSQPNNL